MTFSLLPSFPRFSSLFLLGLALASVLRAESSAFSWAERELSFKATSLDGPITAVYHYQNTSDRTVDITQVKTSCNCATASTSKGSIAPGEKGEISVVFTIDYRTGLQERPIYVYTSDVPDEPTLLQLKVDVLEYVVIKPKLLYWRVNEPAQSKEMEVRVLPGAKPLFGELKCLGEGFKAEVVTDPKSGVTLLRVTPLSTNLSQQAQLQLGYEVEGKKGQVSGFVAIR